MIFELRSLKVTLCVPAGGSTLTSPLLLLSRSPSAADEGGENPLPRAKRWGEGAGERGENPCVWHIGKRPIQVLFL